MNENKPGNTGITRIIKAGGYSMQGLQAAFRYEAAFRQELLLALIFIPLALFVAEGPVERIVLIALTVLVLIVELLNSAIEAVVDRVGAEHHELSGRAKDMGSAAVLVSLLLWVYAWVDILIN
ncbi:MAG: diacylglycerol kinase [Gammaproteobacteria bacterium]|nr:diacylglycerol kinase [Gammaproteobacteria bacterium]